jgi:hypothetical protein
MPGLTVTEKEHWKDRIGKRIDKRIEGIYAEDPNLKERIERDARARALASLNLTDLDAARPRPRLYFGPCDRELAAVGCRVAQRKLRTRVFAGLRPDSRCGRGNNPVRLQSSRADIAVPLRPADRELQECETRVTPVSIQPMRMRTHTDVDWQTIFMIASLAWAAMAFASRTAATRNCWLEHVGTHGDARS